MYELNQAIVPERDMVYDYAGASMFVHRYLLKYKGKTHELPQEVFMIISMLLSIHEQDRVKVAKEIYEGLSLRKISLATPILANLRIPKGDRKSTRLNSSHANISYAVFCLKKKK